MNLFVFEDLDKAVRYVHVDFAYEGTHLHDPSCLEKVERFGGYRHILAIAYLGGPMRRIAYFNFPAFDDAAEKLRAKGWTIHSPAEKDRDVLDVDLCPEGSDEELEAQGFSLAGALTWDFARIAESSCVIFLPGWEQSTGCHWEATVAYALGKPVFQYPEMTPIELPKVVRDPVEVSNALAEMAPQEPVRFKVERVPLQGPGEVRVVDPKTGGEKGQKLARFDLLPWDVLNELAEHYGRGSQKYADRNWQRGYVWSLSIAALGRHLSLWLSGEDDDPETGSSHLIAVAWHALALRWFQKHSKGTDDRYRDAS